MRKNLDPKFWSHGTSLGSLGPGSQQDPTLGFDQHRILVIWGPQKPSRILALQTQAKNLKTAGWRCESRLYFCAIFAWFLGQFCHWDICFLSTPRQMPQTITNIPRCLPQILTLPKFWCHLEHSFSRKMSLVTLRGLF